MAHAGSCSFASMNCWFNFAATSPGEHRVRLEVTDVIQQFARDSLVIRVHEPTPTRRTTWGRIKAPYR